MKFFELGGERAAKLATSAAQGVWNGYASVHPLTTTRLRCSCQGKNVGCFDLQWTSCLLPKSTKQIGNNTRDFTYVENVIQANLLAAFTQDKAAVNQVYNIAYGATTSLNKLFELIATDLKSAVKVIYGDKRKGEIKDSFASIDKAKNLLGYKPTVSLEDGIKKSITWYKNNG